MMINMPLPQIIEKLKAGGLSEAEINKRIQQKMDSLSGLISKEGAAHIIANEIGVKLVHAEGPAQIKNILAGMRNVELAGKITRKYELRTFDKGDRKGSVASLMLSDDTGTVRLVLWNDQTDHFETLKEGDNIRISSALVKENNGRKEVHLNSGSNLDINPEGLEINVKDNAPQKKKISELVAGEENAEVLGTIVQVFDPRFFEVCPSCGKRIHMKDDDYKCDVHGVQQPDHSYVLNLILDDGSSNIRTVLWKQQTQHLLEKTDDQVKTFKENASDFEKVKSDLLGKFIKIIGRVNKNEQFDNLELVANLVFPNPDPKKELELLQPKDDSEEVIAAVKQESFDDVISVDDLEDVE